ncbi:hypothetical protein IPL68_08025 [Candidatus Saccharibacteria bacterium]|nr:MAG: hypothetical protein IPL68_08025 [Candidatus Saccharibacteria bacterium]
MAGAFVLPGTKPTGDVLAHNESLLVVTDASNSPCFPETDISAAEAFRASDLRISIARKIYKVSCPKLWRKMTDGEGYS